MKWITKIAILPLIMVAVASYSQNGLVGYWSFDEIKGDTISNESEFNHPVITHGAKLIDGIKEKALSFNGTSNFAEIPGKEGGTPAVLSQLGEGSIAFWFKVDHIPTDFGIAPMFYYGMEDKCKFFDAANKGLIIELGHTPVHFRSERLYFTMWKNGCTLPTFCYDSYHPIPEGEWHHIVVVVGKDYNTGYLNGKEMNNRQYNFGDNTYSQFFEDAIEHEKLWLGKGHWDETTQYYDGAIDELRIYQKPLTQEEVTELYTAVVATSVKPQNNPTDISLYPIPSDDEIFYDLRNAIINVKTIRLTDTNGRIVLKHNVHSRKGSINISSIPEGIYFAEFSDNREVYRKKILID
jgi:hypothetical protein